MFTLVFPDRTRKVFETVTKIRLPRSRYKLLAWSGRVVYTVKKVSDFPVHSRDVTNQNLPGGEEKSLSFFYSVCTSNFDL
jgi:hypothetical protein